MKYIEKQEAIRLRKEDGLPIQEIAKRLNVAKSSVSLWVRNIVLTDEQKAILLSKNPAFNRQMNGARIRKEEALEIRKQQQEEGKIIAKNKNIEFISMCMLYWAEGTKNKNRVAISNTDYQMLRFFVCCIKKFFNVTNEEFFVKIQWYSDNGVTYEEIREFWSKKLDLPFSCFRKGQVDNISKYSQKKKRNKHVYGTCCVGLDRTDIIQKIFGAIQEFIGFNREEWLW